MRLASIYAIATVLVVGIASQEIFSSLVETLTTTSGDTFSGVWGSISGAGLLFVASVSGGYLQSFSEVQQLYAVIITLITFLTVVWLLRNTMAGHKVNVRDGLYNAGAPIVQITMIALLAMIQMIPFALSLIGYSAASATGLINGGVEAMLFWICAALLTSLSVYWVVGSIFAAVIATLPGMYPYRAIKIAGDLVVGRRFRLVLRLLFMTFIVSFLWAIVMIPAIMFDVWIKGAWVAVDWVPIVPIMMLLLNAVTVIWMSTYVYLLYRRMVDDESRPA